jgi:hypothetical protein
MMAVSGHLSRKMLEHYSHVRMAAKRAAVDALGGGPMQSATILEPAQASRPEPGYVTIPTSVQSKACKFLIYMVGG